MGLCWLFPVDNIGVLSDSATIEFDLADTAPVESAVKEMKAKGQGFIHEARTGPWGQTVARFISPEGMLVGLSYAPWLHGQEA